MPRLTYVDIVDPANPAEVERRAKKFLSGVSEVALARKAGTGDVDAMYLLGARLLRKGYDEMAMTYFRRASDKGDLEAMVQVAYGRATGTGFVQNASVALQLFQVAAKKGNVRAAQALEDIYANGEFGVEKNAGEAAAWHALAVQLQGTVTELGEAQRRASVPLEPIPTAPASASDQTTDSVQPEPEDEYRAHIVLGDAPSPSIPSSTCGKCGHIRTAKDIGPTYACPQCGIVYAVSAPAPSSESRDRTNASADGTLPASDQPIPARIRVDEPNVNSPLSNLIAKLGLTASIVKTVGERWLGAAHDISQADTVILALTGFNPKHLPPEAYRILCDAVNEYWQRMYDEERYRLTLDEVVLLKLVYLNVAAQAMNDPRHQRLFYEAQMQFSVRHADTLRAEVTLHAIQHAVEPIE